MERRRTLNRSKIGHQLFRGFGFLIAMMILSSGVGLFFMDSLFEKILELHNHPFVVSRAILRVDGNILRMQQVLLNLVLMKDQKSIAESRHELGALDDKVHADMDLIRERFLGDPRLVGALYDAFRHWQPQRDEVMALLSDGEWGVATEFVRKSEASSALALSRLIHEFSVFAKGKADTFLQESQDAKTTAMLLNGLLLLSATLVGIVLTVRQIRAIVRPVDRLMSATREVTQGNLETRIGFLGDDELGRLAVAFDAMTLRIHEQVWLKTELAALLDEMQRVGNLKAMVQVLIQRLTPQVGGVVGVLYLANRDNGRLELQASYAFQGGKDSNASFAVGEGLVGQCALEKRCLLRSDLPEEAIHFVSALAAGKPRHILAHPILFGDDLLGVVEVAAFETFTDVHLALVAELSQSIGLVLENQYRFHRTEELLQETQAQSEELVAQQEELRLSNEMLQKQAESLKTSEEELRVQQSQLQEANRTLEERSNRLESEKRAKEEIHQELQRNAVALEKASRYKSEFLANMSHELRTPLNSLLILARTFVQNKEGNLDANQQEAARVIHESGQELLRLINDILDLARIESGRVELNIERLDPASWVFVLESQFQHVAQEKGLALSVVVDPDLPPFFYTDGAKVGQIIRNLVANAMKFTPSGSVEVRFRRPGSVIHPPVPPDFPADGLAITVSDSGIGIPGDKQRLIFEAFQQVDGSIGRQFGGTGLGLSISRELAHVLNGRLEVFSEEGKGSVFAVFLSSLEKWKQTDIPLESPDTPGETTALQEKTAGMRVIVDDRETMKLGDPGLLIIEDDLHFAQTVRAIFRKQGFPCLIALDGQSGLELARNYLPCGIILDLGLPDMDGWTVMDRLKEGIPTRNIPVHMVSGIDGDAATMQKGAIGFLRKPVSDESLAQALERMCHVTGGRMRELLLVEDDPNTRLSLARILGGDQVTVTSVETGTQALAQVAEKPYDCMILDLMLPDMDGLEVLERMANRNDWVKPPVIIYSGKELTRQEYHQLQSYTQSVIIKGERSVERLLDDVVLFLHSVQEKLPETQKRMLRAFVEPERGFKGKTVLLVDDDVRNTFALTRALEPQGLKIIMAASGKKALEILKEGERIDLVLMDIMMPGMDGFQTIQEIRKMPQFFKLPIIAVTAKAMLEDREQCLAAGASDYLAKPVDVDRLLSLMRVWFYP
ncbi:MAG: response regulator [Magnetococcales bacterium]|nr:response regulator [Magnetococcales bacterium]